MSRGLGDVYKRQDQGYATAVVLLVLVVLINFASDKIAGKVAADKAN